MAITSIAALGAGIFGVSPATTAAAATTGTPFANASFAAYGTGSEVHLDAVSNGSVTLAGVEQAFSGVTANSASLSSAVVSPITSAQVQPALTGGPITFGKGSGLEVGLATSPGTPNQVLLPDIATAQAPPTTGLVHKALVPLNIPGIANGALLDAFASAAYSPNFCPVGQPLSYGAGDASSVGLLPDANGVGLVATAGTASSPTNPATATAQSQSRVDLVANADGTFGIVTTVKEIISPISVNLGLNSQLSIAVQGTTPNDPITFQAFDTGEGSAGVRLLSSTPTVAINLVLAGVTAPGFPINVPLSTLQSIINPLLGPASVVSLLLAGLGITLNLSVGNQYPLPGFPAGSAAQGFDLLGLNVGLAGLTIANARIGHMEAAAFLPNGPISCNIPVDKIASTGTVTAGNSFTWSVLIPSSATALGASACDLTNIMATDKITLKPGTSPKYTVTSVDHGGVYNAANQTITWPNLGNYHPGDPPITLTITVAIPADSPAGTLIDTANVSAGLGNCTGGASGQASLVGNAIVTGSRTLIAPNVAVGNGGNNLAATGNGPLLAWAGALLLVMAEGTRRILRRARPQQLS